YDGTPVVLLQPTDLATITKLPLVAAQLLRQAGFTVDIQSMDFQTAIARLQKKDPPAKGGCNLWLAGWPAVDIPDPVTAQLMNASCEKATSGWPCDAELEKLRDAYARAETVQTRKTLAHKGQVRALH